MAGPWNPVYRWTSRDVTPPHNPMSDQQAPSGQTIASGRGSRWRPEWTVNHLVFQGGIPRQPRYSLTGGGFIPSKSFAGKEGLLLQPYVTPVSSITGGGFIPKRTNFLTQLLNGIFENGMS